MIEVKQLINIDEQMLEQQLITAKKTMKASENPQWDENYPLVSDFVADISKQQLYGFFNDNILIGICALTTDYEAHYYQENDQFKFSKKTDNILYIHRILKFTNAGKIKGTDFLNIILKNFNMYQAIQVDTNQKNIPMQRAIEKAGFIKRGIFKRIINNQEVVWNTYEFVN